MRSTPTAKIVIDKARKRKDGTFPVNLRITYKRIPRSLTLDYKITEKDYDKVTAKNAKGRYKLIQKEWLDIEMKAMEILQSMEVYSWESFVDLYLYDKQEAVDVFGLFQSRIDSLIDEERIKTARSFKTTLSKLKAFKPKKKTLDFREINHKFLHEFERFMLMEGLSVTTVGIYMRTIKVIYNIAIEKGIVEQDAYPFGRRKYQAPSSKNTKKAISIEDFKKIKEYTPANARQEFAKDLWMFSVICNGMNIKDIAYLTDDSIKVDSITFKRAKTIRSKRTNQQPITVPLTKTTRSILEKYKKDSNLYLFPILQKGLNAIQCVDRVESAIKRINKGLKEIKDALELDKPLTTYSARHTFSTILKNKGANIQFISESLGHSDPRVTRSYLDSFEDKAKIEWANVLENI